MKRTLGALAVVVVATALAACGSDAEPEGQESPPAESEEVEVGFTREDPFRPGDPITLGDWELTIGETSDATDKVMNAQRESWGGDEEYMTPPTEGNVYIAFPLEVTYTGDDRDDPAYALSIALVTADGNVFDEIQTLDSPEDDLYNVGELYTDASGEGFFYMEAPDGVIDGATWRITEAFTTADEVYVATT
jgi:hypothetical protein